jgi:hypothetical protein
MSIERKEDLSLVWNQLTEEEKNTCLDFSTVEWSLGLGEDYFSIYKDGRNIVNHLIGQGIIEANSGRIMAQNWINENSEEIKIVLGKKGYVTERESKLLRDYRTRVAIVTSRYDETRYRLSQAFQDFVSNNSSTSPDIE